MRLLENFDHEGPNGNHRCLVLELLGPNVSSEAEAYESNRLPGQIAWEVAKQTTQALAYMHAMGIAHGGQSSRSEPYICSTLSV
jgi:serine/threonine-protein kinase SRPK3